ncbi:MATE efflux family protein [Trichoderma novae-zelandiae]
MDCSRKRTLDAEEDEESGFLSSLSRPISPPRKRTRQAQAHKSPWQLTRIRDLPEEWNKDTVRLRDILGDPLINECWQFNFLHDIPFMLSAFDEPVRDRVQLHVVHGFWKKSDVSRVVLSDHAAQHHNVHLHCAPMSEMFGTHHSKMMILFRSDDTVQVVIHTANMIPRDWTNMTNAVWKSPKLPRLREPDTLFQQGQQLPIGSGTRFKVDLLAYLMKYELYRPTCKQLVDRLVNFDFSSIRAAFIGSVPGRHNFRDASSPAWGWAALQRCLRCVPVESGQSQIVVQISSIATLGAKDDWLQNTLFNSLATSQTLNAKRPGFKVVFPTADEIRNSLDGYASGHSIHTKIQSPQQIRQLSYLKPVLHHWANDSAGGAKLPGESPISGDSGRNRAAPHIKTYIRFNESNSIDWAMLTSANMSKQAWGEALSSTTGNVRIASWEVGVLVWPGLLCEDGVMSLVSSLVLPFSILYDNITMSPAGSGIPGPSGLDHPAFPSSFRAGSPLAEQVLAQDIAECTDDDFDAADDQIDAEHGHHFMYRRPSGVAYGAARPAFNPSGLEEPILTPLERKQSRDAERSLLRDNHVLPPKHANKSQSIPARIYRKMFSTKVPVEEYADEPEDDAPLLSRDDDLDYGTRSRRQRAAPAGDDDVDEDVDEQWEEAITTGRIRTTWQREAKTVLSYCGPLIVTFVLQYSINVAGIFAVGRIGTIELGAISLANMSQAISCLAPFQGLATSLDTLCAQAYGSGHKHLVGLQCQRMACFLLTLSVPVIILWLFGAEPILQRLVPDPESARLAALYLRVMIFAIPGIILFECGKRFTQSQGLFQATTYVLLFAAPFNVFLTWLLVWKLEYGFVGAPIAVAITENILPVLLFCYVRFVNGRECWGGFSKRALSNWWVMIRLALPGMIMVEAEWLAFEILTLLASRFGSEYLAAQSVVSTLASISYQIPFPMSIAASTRVANLIGAGLVDAARITGKVTFVAHCIVGLLNFAVYSGLRYHLPLLFTDDDVVISIVASILPVVAVMQVFDCLSAGAHGLLRGIGKQSIGGPVNLISYYVVSLPISLALAFGADWKLQGLWAGVSVGLFLQTGTKQPERLPPETQRARSRAMAYVRPSRVLLI